MSKGPTEPRGNDHATSPTRERRCAFHEEWMAGRLDGDGSGRSGETIGNGVSRPTTPRMVFLSTPNALYGAIGPGMRQARTARMTERSRTGRYHWRSTVSRSRRLNHSQVTRREQFDLFSRHDGVVNRTGVPAKRVSEGERAVAVKRVFLGSGAMAPWATPIGHRDRIVRRGGPPARHGMERQARLRGRLQ